MLLEGVHKNLFLFDSYLVQPDDGVTKDVCIFLCLTKTRNDPTLQILKTVVLLCLGTSLVNAIVNCSISVLP